MDVGLCLFAATPARADVPVSDTGDLRYDIVRSVLEECDALVQSGKPKRAIDLARMVMRIAPDSPATPLLRKIETDLEPKTR